MSSPTGFANLFELALPDQAVHSDLIPWVPQGERVWYKPLRFDLANGRWVNLLKVSGRGRVNRHRHSSQVLGYCIQGSWHYPEREWVAPSPQPAIETRTPTFTMLALGSHVSAWTQRIIVIAFVLTAIGLALELV